MSVKMVSPWVEYYRKIEALFKEDAGIQVIYDDDNKEVKVYVADALKADALSQVMPTEKTWGNVTLKIEVIPANGFRTSRAELFETIFAGNPAVSFIRTIEGVFTNKITYVVFKKEVVQYFNDDLGDYYGQCSTLYQDLAKEIFGEQDGIFFCTEKRDSSAVIPF